MPEGRISKLVFNNLGDRTDSINGFLSRNSYIMDMTRQTYGDKVVSQEGNSPKQEYKVPKLLFSAKKDVCLDLKFSGCWLGDCHNLMSM